MCARTHYPSYGSFFTLLSMKFIYTNKNHFVSHSKQISEELHRIISLTNSNAQFFIHQQYVCYTIVLDMFRALTCPVHRLRADWVRSQPVYCAAVYRERRYQMLCEYNFSSRRWAC